MVKPYLGAGALARSFPQKQAFRRKFRVTGKVDMQFPQSRFVSGCRDMGQVYLTIL